VQWRDRIRALAVLIIDRDGEKVLGPRFIRLLEEIDRQGSVRQAALTLGLGYRHAIAWIRRAESVLDRSLVVRQAGGAAGGGSGLTADGELLIHRYHRVSRAIGKVVARAEHDILEGR
jgi:molybdate transport repressor ModE-like protein